MALCRKYTHSTYQEIADSFSSRHHAAVIHSIKRLPKIESEPRYALLVQTVCNRLAELNKVSKTSVHSATLSWNFLKSDLSNFSGSSQSLSL